MIVPVIMGAYLFILSVSDMIKKAIRPALLCLGIIPLAVSLVPEGAVSGLWMPPLAQPEMLERAAGLAVGLVILLIGRITREKIGYGDGAVICAAGPALGFFEVCTMLGIAMFLLLFYSLVMLARGRLKKNSRVPFLPFLFAGFVLSLFVE